MNGTTPPSLPGRTQKTDGLAITSLVLGILGIVACLSILTAIPGVICGHIALSRIKQSGGLIGGRSMAVTGLVIGYFTIAISVVFIPMMAAIAIPNFVHARQTALKNGCINNLRQIEGAKQQWGVENQKSKNEVPAASDLEKYLGPAPNVLTCPAGGSYNINSLSEAPTCSIPTHQLPN